jgi:predicted ester cyclase
MHTLDNSGDVYVESPIYYSYTLGDFFAVWGQVFTNDQILALHADSNHMITMTVNGIPNLQFENHVVAAGEQITITLT